MENQPITLRGFFQSIGEWLEAAVEWGIETFNRVIDADLTRIFEIIGVLLLITVFWFIMTELIWPEIEQKIDEWGEAKRRKKRRDLGYDDEEE